MGGFAEISPSNWDQPHPGEDWEQRWGLLGSLRARLSWENREFQSCREEREFPSSGSFSRWKDETEEEFSFSVWAEGA